MSAMEKDLPDGAFVLGIDEHTACVLDLNAGTASVQGRGVMTVRATGRSTTFASGETLPIAGILETAEALARGGGHRAVTVGGAGAASGGGAAGAGGAASGEGGVTSPGEGQRLSTSPLVDLVREPRRISPLQSQLGTWRRP